MTLFVISYFSLYYYTDDTANYFSATNTYEIKVRSTSRIYLSLPLISKVIILALMIALVAVEHAVKAWKSVYVKLVTSILIVVLQQQKYHMIISKKSLLMLKNLNFSTLLYKDLCKLSRSISTKLLAMWIFYFESIPKTPSISQISMGFWEKINSLIVLKAPISSSLTSFSKIILETAC